MKANEFEVEVVQKQNIYAAKKIINCENYISTFCANKINVYELDNDFTGFVKVSPRSQSSSINNFFLNINKIYCIFTKFDIILKINSIFNLQEINIFRG